MGLFLSQNDYKSLPALQYIIIDRVFPILFENQLFFADFCRHTTAIKNHKSKTAGLSVTAVAALSVCEYL